MRVFIDSDVVISSLLSSSGAAYSLINQLQIKPVISLISPRELKIVVKIMGIDSDKLERLIKNRFEVWPLKKGLKEIKKEYALYVMDINDAHIVAGADGAKVKYLISYNIRHFDKDKIKNELGLMILTPALFLQYQRSQ